MREIVKVQLCTVSTASSQHDLELERESESYINLRILLAHWASYLLHIYLNLSTILRARCLSQFVHRQLRVDVVHHICLVL